MESGSKRSATEADLMAGSANQKKYRKQQQQQHMRLHDSLTISKNDAVRETKSWQHQATASRRRAAQLRDESRRLLQQAQHMEQNERMQQSYAKVSRKLSASLDFETLLLRLRSNDATTVAVHGITQKFPRGYGKALGEALRHNTRVSKLDLDLCRFLSSLGLSETEAKQEMQPLLEYLDSNPKSLMTFAARGPIGDGARTPVFRTVAYSLLESISKLAHIEQFKWNLPIRPSSLRAILTTCQALKTLDIEWYEAAQFSTNDQRSITSAIESNTSLESLRLVAFGNVNVKVAIVASLSSSSHLSPTHIHQLRELHLVSTLSDEAAVFEALSAFLQCTCTLHRLVLDSYHLDDEDTTILLSGLQRMASSSDGSTTDGQLPTVFLASLRLRRCKFLEDSCTLLSSFLQTPTTGDNGETIFCSNLREIYISKEFLSEKGPDEYHFIADALLMTVATPTSSRGANTNATADNLCRLRPRLVPTIGSQIRSLSLARADAAFFHHWTEHADRVRVQTLEVCRVAIDASAACYQCIPKLTSLCTLKVAAVDPRNMLIMALKNSGSICEVDTIDENGRCDFGASELRLIQAHCQRNEDLGSLLDSPVAISNANVHPKREGDDTSTSTSLIVADIPIRPPLLAVAMQAPSSSPANVLRGVQRLGHSNDTQSEP